VSLLDLEISRGLGEDTHDLIPLRAFPDPYPDVGTPKAHRELDAQLHAITPSGAP